MPKRNPGKFTELERKFIEHFNGNATDAARRAGSKNPRRYGSELLARKHVHAEIQKKLAAATTESAKRSIRKITFGRNDIIMALGDLAGIGDKNKIAESESARASALRTLADMYDLIPKSNEKHAGLFKGWTDEELDEYRLTGKLPTRFGLSAEDYNANNPGTNAGLGASAISDASGPTLGHGKGDGGTSPQTPPTRV